jgi:hypothetical protein
MPKIDGRKNGHVGCLTGLGVQRSTGPGLFEPELCGAEQSAAAAVPVPVPKQITPGSPTFPTAYIPPIHIDKHHLSSCRSARIQKPWRAGVLDFTQTRRGEATKELAARRATSVGEYCRIVHQFSAKGPSTTVTTPTPILLASTLHRSDTCDLYVHHLFPSPPSSCIQPPPPVLLR